MTLLFSLLILKAKDYSVRLNRHTAEVRYPEAQDNGIRPNRHTAEMRYPVAWVMAGLVTLHSFIHSSGFRIKYGMPPLFSSLILKAKDYSVRLKRHTAEMRYPVAWIIAVLNPKITLLFCLCLQV